MYWYIKALGKMQHCLCRLPQLYLIELVYALNTNSESNLRAVEIAELWRFWSRIKFVFKLVPEKAWIFTLNWKSQPGWLQWLFCDVWSFCCLGEIQLRRNPKWLIWLPMGRILFSEGATRLDSDAVLLLGSNLPYNLYRTRYLDNSWSIPCDFSEFLFLN